MEEFDLATYLSAVAAVGAPLFFAIVYAIRKGGPYVKKWLDKMLDGVDELGTKLTCHAEESEAEKKALRDAQEDIMDRLEKGDKKFESILKKIEVEGKEQANMLNFMIENRTRIIDLERGKVAHERMELEYDKEKFKKHKEEECK